MNVRELIEHLSTLDGDLRVALGIEEEGYDWWADSVRVEMQPDGPACMIEANFGSGIRR